MSTWRWSSNRPGVATSRLTPFCSFSVSFFRFAPPIMMPWVKWWWESSSHATPYVCKESSRVGDIMTTPVPDKRNRRKSKKNAQIILRAEGRQHERIWEGIKRKIRRLQAKFAVTGWGIKVMEKRRKGTCIHLHVLKAQATIGYSKENLPTITWFKLKFVKKFHSRNEKRKSLSTACLSCPH